MRYRVMGKDKIEGLSRFCFLPGGGGAVGACDSAAGYPTGDRRRRLWDEVLQDGRKRALPGDDRSSLYLDCACGYTDVYICGQVLVN